MNSCVYLITDGLHHKIGRAQNPVRRLATLQTAHSRPLTLIGYVPGGKDEEALLHQRFAHARQSGEWFALSVEELDELTSAFIPYEPQRNPRRQSRAKSEEERQLSAKLTAFFKTKYGSAATAEIHKLTGIKRSTIDSWLSERSVPGGNHLGTLLECFGPALLAAIWVNGPVPAWVGESEARWSRHAARLEAENADAHRPRDGPG